DHPRAPVRATAGRGRSEAWRAKDGRPVLCCPRNATGGDGAGDDSRRGHLSLPAWAVRRSSDAAVHAARDLAGRQEQAGQVPEPVHGDPVRQRALPVGRGAARHVLPPPRVPEPGRRGVGHVRARLRRLLPLPGVVRRAHRAELHVLRERGLAVRHGAGRVRSVLGRVHAHGGQAAGRHPTAPRPPHLRGTP
ncbi:Protein of unknown function, partial [Gryllus bimaculatus]